MRKRLALAGNAGLRQRGKFAVRLRFVEHWARKMRRRTSTLARRHPRGLDWVGVGVHFSAAVRIWRQRAAVVRSFVVNLASILLCMLRNTAGPGPGQSSQAGAQLHRGLWRDNHTGCGGSGPTNTRCSQRERTTAPSSLLDTKYLQPVVALASLAIDSSQCLHVHVHVHTQSAPPRRTANNLPTHSASSLVLRHPAT